MKITLLQQDVKWADPAANQREAEQNLLTAPRAELYVLPEMWSTGFAAEPEGIAERDCSSLRWMQRMADRLDAAIAGSVATEEGGRFFNRFYFVTPGSAASVPCDSVAGPKYYDKHHLFTFGGEHLRYTPGKERVVVEWRGVRFLLQVCYDLRFPIFSRNELITYNSETYNYYDVALYVASWPSVRRLPWDTLLRARAIENQCYVCGVNRVGSDPSCQYNGGTAAIDPYGRIIAACPDDEVSSISFEADMEKLAAFRRKFPVLSDRDNFPE